jgi:hypothetical protein
MSGGVELIELLDVKNHELFPLILNDLGAK